MNIVFMGGEVPSHRKLLLNAGVKHIGINYFRLMKRGLPKTKDYLLSEKYPEDVKIYVDPGSNQINELSLSGRELEEYAADYQDWITINDDRISGATELDSNALGLAWIIQQRRTFWEDFGEERFCPIWNSGGGGGGGYASLFALVEQYSQVGILGKYLEADTSLATRCRALQNQFPDLNFHGIACAKPDNLRSVNFTTASTLSWLSPMMRGETIVWDGTRLVRYQKKMKSQARPP